jgi:hypothetical protein
MLILFLVLLWFFLLDVNKQAKPETNSYELPTAAGEQAIFCSLPNNHRRVADRRYLSETQASVAVRCRRLS